MDGAAALQRAAQLGPFFAVETSAAPAAAGPGWRPARELVEPGPLAERIAAVRAGLARTAGVAPDAVEERVAASVAHLGLASRLLCPALGAAVLAGAVPDLALDALRYRPQEGQPVPLAHTRPRAHAGAGPDGLGRLLAEVVVAGPVRELTDAVRDLAAVSPTVLRGNVASALAGAVGSVVRADPAHAAVAVAVGRAALDPADGTVTPAPWAYRRRSCCLIYRVPGYGTCGDCVLVGRGTGTDGG